MDFIRIKEKHKIEIVDEKIFLIVTMINYYIKDVIQIIKKMKKEKDMMKKLN